MDPLASTLSRIFFWSTSNSTTRLMSALFSCKTLSKSLAWAPVLGNPSRSHSESPLSQSFSNKWFLMTPTIVSSGTSFPSSISLEACKPNGVPRATSARRISPEESELRVGNAFTSLDVCVPLPDPGAPRRRSLSCFANFIVFLCECAKSAVKWVEIVEYLYFASIVRRSSGYHRLALRGCKWHLT